MLSFWRRTLCHVPRNLWIDLRSFKLWRLVYDHPNAICLIPLGAAKGYSSKWCWNTCLAKLIQYILCCQTRLEMLSIARTHPWCFELQTGGKQLFTKAEESIHRYSPTLRWIIVLVYTKPVNSKRYKMNVIWSKLGWKSDYSRPLCFTNQWIFQWIFWAWVANQSARKLILSALVYTNEEYLNIVCLLSRNSASRWNERKPSLHPASFVIFNLFPNRKMRSWWILTWFLASVGKR